MTVLRFLSTLVAVAAACFGTLRGHGAPADAVEFAQTYYTIEVVLFARDTHVEPTDGERLEVTEPRHFPGSLSAFAASNAERAAIYRLDSNEDLEPFVGTPARTKLVSDPAAPETTGTPAIPPAPPSEKERIEKALAELELRWAADSFASRPTSELRLTNHASRLSRNGMRVVWHGAWLQRVPDRDNEAHQPVLVQLGDRSDDGFEVEGEIDVTRGRFLHLDTALWFRAPTPGSYFELAESRRMRSGELNYLDHPKYGMLVRIDPVALPADLAVALEALDEAQ